MRDHKLEADNFDALLALFSDDREEAGEKYEQMRRSLERFFQFKGCADPQSLADETMNRVAAKADSFDPTRNVRPTAYFYGFASNILLEYRRIARREYSLSDTLEFVRQTFEEDDAKELESGCLQSCLEKMPGPERKMIVEYYASDGQEKKRVREELCETIQCSMATLYTKIFRLKAILRGCIEICIDESV